MELNASGWGCEAFLLSELWSLIYVQDSRKPIIFEDWEKCGELTAVRRRAKFDEETRWGWVEQVEDVGSEHCKPTGTIGHRWRGKASCKNVEHREGYAVGME